MYYSYMRFCSGDGNSAVLRELTLYAQSLVAKLTVDKVLKSLLQIVFKTLKRAGRTTQGITTETKSPSPYSEFRVYNNLSDDQA